LVHRHAQVHDYDIPITRGRNGMWAELKVGSASEMRDELG
jgi:hypothetical protein